MRNPAWCRRQAGQTGPATVQVIEALMEVNALHRLRSAQGILAAGLEAEPVPPPAGDGGAAAFLHGPALLFAAAASGATR